MAIGFERIPTVGDFFVTRPRAHSMTNTGAALPQCTQKVILSDGTLQDGPAANSNTILGPVTEAKLISPIIGKIPLLAVRVPFTQKMPNLPRNPECWVHLNYGANPLARFHNVDVYTQNWIKQELLEIAKTPLGDPSLIAGGNSSQIAQNQFDVAADDTSCDEQADAATVCDDVPTIHPTDTLMDDADQISDLMSETGTMFSVGTAAHSLSGTVASLAGSAARDLIIILDHSLMLLSVDWKRKTYLMLEATPRTNNLKITRHR